MKLLSLILLCTALAFPVSDAQCNSSVPYPPDWPQNCTNAYAAHARNISSFSPEDRAALIGYLNVACPDCHNSFIDYGVMCGTFDEDTGEFWRSTYCLRDDVRENNEYCRVIIYDFIDTTTMDEDYLTECANLRSGGTNCTSGCQDVLMRTQNYLGCCTRLYGYLSMTRINQAHYDTCNMNIPRQCGSPTSVPGGYAHLIHGHGSFILMALAFSLMTFV